MRWTPKGAHLLLQTRTRVLNGDLDQLIRCRYPNFRKPADAGFPRFVMGSSPKRCRRSAISVNFRRSSRRAASAGTDRSLSTTPAACTGGSTGTPRAPLRQPLDGHSASRGSPLWTTGTNRRAGGVQFWTPMRGQYSTPIDTVPPETSAGLLIGGRGEEFRTPAFQRRDADPNLVRHFRYGRTLRRQKTRDHALFELLTVLSHVCRPSPLKVPILSGRQLL